MRILIALLLVLPAFSQVSVYGSLGAVESNYWSNYQLSFGGGAAFTYKRFTVGGEVWRSEVGRLQTSFYSADHRAEAVVATVAYRTWRGLHAEGGGGVQRLTHFAYGPLIEGTFRYSASFGTAGAYYQIGDRLFARFGYRRLFVVDDHDTNQIYTSIGVTF